MRKGLYRRKELFSRRIRGVVVTPVTSASGWQTARVTDTPLWITVPFILLCHCLLDHKPHIRDSADLITDDYFIALE